jgi:hypothetical protein
MFIPKAQEKPGLRRRLVVEDIHEGQSERQMPRHTGPGCYALGQNAGSSARPHGYLARLFQRAIVSTSVVGTKAETSFQSPDLLFFSYTRRSSVFTVFQNVKPRAAVLWTLVCYISHLSSSRIFFLPDRSIIDSAGSLLEDITSNTPTRLHFSSSWSNIGKDGWFFI